ISGDTRMTRVAKAARSFANSMAYGNQRRQRCPTRGTLSLPVFGEGRVALASSLCAGLVAASPQPLPYPSPSARAERKRGRWGPRAERAEKEPHPALPEDGEGEGRPLSAAR